MTGENGTRRPPPVLSRGGTYRVVLPATGVLRVETGGKGGFARCEISWYWSPEELGLSLPMLVAMLGREYGTLDEE
jgi:hypothetical protein